MSFVLFLSVLLLTQRCHTQVTTPPTGGGSITVHEITLPPTATVGQSNASFAESATRDGIVPSFSGDTNATTTAEFSSGMTATTILNDELTSDTASGAFPTDATTPNDVSGSNPADATTNTITSALQEGSGSAESGSGLPSDTTTVFETATTDIGSGTETDAMTEEIGSGTKDDATTPETDTGSSTTQSSGVDELSTAQIFDFSTSNATTIALLPISSGLAWYIIVIICLGIIILFLVIAFIVGYCLYKKASKLPVEKKDGTIATDAVDDMALPPAAGYVRQAPTIRPQVENEKTSKVNFVSEAQMTAPVLFPSPAGKGQESVRKRDIARPTIEPRTPSVDEDEGFAEETEKVTKKPLKRKVSRMKLEHRSPESSFEMDSKLPEQPPPQYHPFFLPTPVQTALSTKGLGDQLTQGAPAERHQLQRSDIERHRNKQRLRQKREYFQNNAYMDEQHRISAVLTPAPPTVLQGPAQRRRTRMDVDALTGLREQEASSARVKRRKHKRRTSDSDSTDTSDGSRPSHEVVLAKMASLLAEAYTLLSPTVQKNLVRPAAQQSQSGALAPPPQETTRPQLSQTNANENEKFFTRTQTPPALLPQQGIQTSHAAPGYGSNAEKANGANSIVWTPYRAYDQMTKLQQEHPSITIPLRAQQPRTVNSDTNFLTPARHPAVYPPQSVQSPNQVSEHPWKTESPKPVARYPYQSSDNIPAVAVELQNIPPDPDFSYSEQYGNEDEPASSIVQSIKDTLAKIAGSSTPVKDLQKSNC